MFSKFYSQQALLCYLYDTISNSYISHAKNALNMKNISKSANFHLRIIINFIKIHKSIPFLLSKMQSCKFQINS